MKAWLLLASVLLGGCRKSKCEDIEPVPVAGSYRGGGSLGEERLLNVAVEATSKQVVLTYTALDGARIRATYKVNKKLKQR